MGNWPIATKLWLMSGMLMINLLMVGTAGYLSANALVAQIDDLADNHLPAVRNMTLADMMHDGIRAEVFKALLISETGNSKEAKDTRDELEEFSNKIRSHIKAIHELSLTAETQKAVQEAGGELEQYIDAAHSIIFKALDGKRKEALTELPNFQQSFGKLEKKMEVLGDRIEKEASESRAKGKSLNDRAKKTEASVMILGLAIGLLIAYFQIRNLSRALKEITQQLNQESVQVSVAASEINQASQELSEATTQQAAAIEETVSSMEEMTSMLSQTAQQSNQSLALSEEGHQDSERAKEVITRLSNAMEEILESNTQLAGLTQVIEEIRKKTHVINEIVFETRLLSFNASIEAARAGAQGKGFAVVAEEVGKLASMSGRAADEIHELLDSSVTEVRDVIKNNQERVLIAKDVTHECESTFGSMGGSLQKIARSVRTIASATHEQEAGVRQTNQAMNEMEQVTQKNTRSAEALASQSSRLHAGAQTLEKTLAVMRRLVHGGEADVATAARPGNSIERPRPIVKEATPSPQLERSVVRSDSRWKTSA